MVFVVEGQLYGDGGQCLEAVRLRGRGRVVPIEEVLKLVAVEAIYAQKGDDKTINYQTEDLPRFHISMNSFYSLVSP